MQTTAENFLAKLNFEKQSGALTNIEWTFEREGLEHEAIFTAYLNNTYTGQGATKKEAKHNAAKHYFENKKFFVIPNIDDVDRINMSAIDAAFDKLDAITDTNNDAITDDIGDNSNVIEKNNEVTIFLDGDHMSNLFTDDLLKRVYRVNVYVGYTFDVEQLQSRVTETNYKIVQAQSTTKDAADIYLTIEIANTIQKMMDNEIISSEFHGHYIILSRDVSFSSIETYYASNRNFAVKFLSTPSQLTEYLNSIKE